MRNNIKSLIVASVEQLNSPTAKLDSEVILSHILGVERVDLFYKEIIVSSEQILLFKEMIERRKLKEPVAYIIGKKDFWKHEFKVTKNTLIPRPETELIIELVLKLFPDIKSKLDILDLGVGTGCIALSLLDEYENSQALLVDIDEATLDVAKENAELLRVSHRADFIVSNWFDNVPKKKFDIIVSNPPYINFQDELGEGVKEFEPHKALFAGDDGFACYLEIAKRAKEFLKKDSYILLEIGKGQENRIVEIFSEYKLHSINKDLSGTNRVLVFF